jgi:S-DNA-T family DNA segregation ATPase FtsK/SpoIIIE
MTYPLGSLRSSGGPLNGPADVRPTKGRGKPVTTSSPAAALSVPSATVPSLRLQLGVVLGGVLWLLWLVAMLSHHAEDAAFSTSGITSGTTAGNAGAMVHNLAGTFGAWWSDLSYVLFGYSVWWCVAFAGRRWLSALARWLRGPSSRIQSERVQSRPKALMWLGLVLLLAASCALEWTRLYRFEPSLAGAHAGGILGAALGPWSMHTLGFLGSGLVWIVLMLTGFAWAFRFSWVELAERIGGWTDGVRERRQERIEHAEDLRIGERALREREHVVEVERQVAEELPPLVIEPALAEVPKSDRVAKERQTSLWSDLDATKLPQVDLLDGPSAKQETVTPETLEMTSRLIEKKLKDFGVEVRVLAAQPGPVITRYEIEPATGVKG